MSNFYILARDQFFFWKWNSKRIIRKTHIGREEMNFDDSEAIMTNSKRSKDINFNNIINNLLKSNNEKRTMMFMLKRTNNPRINSGE